MTKEQYKELFQILTPRMQKKLIAYAEKLEREQEFLNNHNNEDESGDWDDFTIKGNTLFL